jgi:hypothetical protein
VTSTTRAILGNRTRDRDLDPLAEGDGGHPAALAAAAQAQVGGVLLDRDQLRMPAVRGDGRVDLPVDHLDDPLGDVAAEVGGRRSVDGRARGCPQLLAADPEGRFFASRRTLQVARRRGDLGLARAPRRPRAEPACGKRSTRLGRSSLSHFDSRAAAWRR